MDPISAITAALIAGATAAASDTASTAVKDAYQGLKKLLVDGYNFASTALLDKKPKSEVTESAVSAELKETPKVADDKAILEATRALQEALSRAAPAQLAAWGVDIKTIEAGQNFIAERISGTGGGVRGDKITAKGDVRLSDIMGGSAPQGKV
jgi:UDP-N-acetylmuramyl pentapeptide synthase